MTISTLKGLASTIFPSEISAPFRAKNNDPKKLRNAKKGVARRRRKDVKLYASDTMGGYGERVARTVVPTRQEAAEERKQASRGSSVRWGCKKEKARHTGDGDGTRKRRRKEVVVLVSTG